jgi:Ca-activated chloride channel homolog
MKKLLLILPLLALAAWLTYSTLRTPNFWTSPDRRGDRLIHKGQFAEAAKTYSDPARIGIAQYRNGDFEAAARTFARVPGAVGAFNQGNALLMHGKYAAAINSYDRAMLFRPGWQNAQENKAIALARQAALDQAGKDRDQESADAYKPDQIVFDQKGDDQKSKPLALSNETVSEEEFRATWLRQVRTTPGDFLRAKFAFEAANAAQPAGGVK